MTSMRTWLSQAENGESVLMRSGTGRVTAVADVSSSDFGIIEPMALIVVEIECEAASPARSVRVTTRGVCPTDSEIAGTATLAHDLSARVSWMIEWSRRPGIPAHLPIETLQLKTDATPRLVALALADQPAFAAAMLRDGDEPHHLDSGLS